MLARLVFVAVDRLYQDNYGELRWLSIVVGLWARARSRKRRVGVIGIAITDALHALAKKDAPNLCRVRALASPFVSISKYAECRAARCRFGERIDVMRRDNPCLHGQSGV